MSLNTKQNAVCCLVFMSLLLMLIIRLHPETLMSGSIDSSTRILRRNRRSLLNNIDKETVVVGDAKIKVQYPLNIFQLLHGSHQMLIK